MTVSKDVGAAVRDGQDGRRRAHNKHAILLFICLIFSPCFSRVSLLPNKFSEGWIQ